MRNILKWIAVILISLIIGYLIGDTPTSCPPVNSRESNTSSTRQEQLLNPIKEELESINKVEIKSHTQKIDRGYPKIVGEVINNINRSVTYVKIIATFYDSEGVVVGTDFTFAGDTTSTPLEPNQTTPFEVRGEKGLTFDSYKLDVTWD
jgi:hypothetical protein